MVTAQSTQIAESVRMSVGKLYVPEATKISSTALWRTAAVSSATMLTEGDGGGWEGEGGGGEGQGGGGLGGGGGGGEGGGGSAGGNEGEGSAHEHEIPLVQIVLGLGSGHW